MALSEFFRMGGYGFYVWSAYGCMAALLFLQWFFPWRRWRKYLHKQKERHEQNT